MVSFFIPLPDPRITLLTCSVCILLSLKHGIDYFGFMQIKCISTSWIIVDIQYVVIMSFTGQIVKIKLL